MHDSALPIVLVLSLGYSYSREVLRGVRQFARGKNWILYSLMPHADLHHALVQLKPAGIIAQGFGEDIARTLGSVERPVVHVSHDNVQFGFAEVNIEDLAIGAMAAEHLMDCGLRHFGYFGPSRYGPDTGREGGFRQALERIAHTCDVCYTDGLGFDPYDMMSASTEETRSWVRKLPKPAGVFTPNDPWGLWLSDICRQEDIRIPEDIAIIGVDNDELICELAQPSLSSVAIPAQRVGYEAAALLDRLIAGEPRPKQPTLLAPLGVVARQSSDVLAVDDPDLAAAIRYIRTHAFEPISVTNIVDCVAISRRSLERKFRAVLGHSPTEEIQRLRVARAKTLLESTDLQMPQVASRSGFSSPKQLSTVFRQALGVTPSAYRRQSDVASGVTSQIPRVVTTKPRLRRELS